MVRSDFIVEVRRYLVNPAEHRLRAPWRVVIWFFLTAFLVIVLGAVLGLVPPLAERGPLAAVSAIGRRIALFALGVGVALGVGSLLDRRRLADYGLGLDGQWWRDAGFGLALGFGLPTVGLVALAGVGYLTVGGVLAASPTDAFAFAGTGPLVRLALLVPFFLVQASAEEILVRGYLLTNLAEGLSGWLGAWRSTVVAVALTGALFGVLHWTNPASSTLSVANITLYGVLLGGCYALTGRLGIACGFHVAWNYTLVLWGFPVSGIRAGVALLSTRATGPSLVTGGDFGLEGGLLALALLGVGTAALWWWVRREYGRVELLASVATPDLRVATRREE
ncbi:CPBP family intramembrane glutamic endopeptidase [Haloarcula litorea]|uniref:CPBP family intramembrane glutamic endopeptidase n=1 Tax=Haloarcula litorea TaxID=3032579 RepID=UPI0023E8B73B|nr:type II CAAX endopeptidase family protein [Halomicroarcula sp. GDY20]